MNDLETAKPIDLREYLAILRTRKWTIILVAALVVGSALGFSYWQTPIYTGRARVLTQPVVSVVGEPETLDIATQAELLRSEPVAELVRDELRLDESPGQLLENLTVTAVATTRVLEVIYNSPSPEKARDLANSFSENYLEYRATQALEAVELAQRDVKRQIAETNRELSQVTGDIEAATADGNETLLPALESSRNILLARLGVLEQQLSDLRPDEDAIAAGDVIEVAKLPAKPSSPNYVRNGVLAMILGAILGTAFAFVKERLDDRFRGRSDVEQAVSAPVLATIPRFKTGRKSAPGPQDVVVEAEPRGVASEAFRSLRTNLQFIVNQRDLRSVVITSAGAAEGKTITTANLGVALAHAGSRVILVSADLRRPSLEKYLEVSNEAGLTSWLSSPDDDPLGIVHDPGIANLRVIPSGPVAPNPAELLSSRRLTNLIEVLEENCDLVLIDSPPVIAVADPVIIAGKTDAALLVIDAAKTHKSATVRAKQEIERSGGMLIGTVINAFEPSASPYYYYDSPYYYSYSQPYAKDAGDGDRAGRPADTPAAQKSRFSFRNR